MEAPAGVSKADALTVPPADVLREIERKQIERARQIAETRAKRVAEEEAASRGGDGGGQEQEAQRQKHAAEVIQKNFRGYRDRRALRGHGLDPGMRWMEALREAKFHTVMQPRPRGERTSPSPEVRDRWKKAGALARRVGSDATSESELGEGEEDDEERAKARQQKKEKKAEREKFAKTIGLEYFLEAVDQKHRYGSSLRKYHDVWNRSDTGENFFYWLDYGEGKEVDLEERPRKKLDAECVRYLSREERQNYLVKIDEQGRFYWAKNGELISTTPDFKDSIDGVVPVDDKTPTWREVTTGEAPQPSLPDSDGDSDSDSVSGISTGSNEAADKYTNDELRNAKGLAKLKHVSTNAVTNHMLRKTTKKNTWIFVADTSFRLYVGIKQSGAFQHSSFLKGARVSAAGLIKIKNGRLRKISPLSGHYAPPVRNFRAFAKTLREEGADLSRCSTSRSYAVLLGLEGYQGAMGGVKKAKRSVRDVFNPSEKRAREEAARDKSRSAQLEREALEKEAQLRRDDGLGYKMMKKMSLGQGRRAETQASGGLDVDGPS